MSFLLCQFTHCILQEVAAEQKRRQADARLDVEKRRRVEAEATMSSQEIELRAVLGRLATAERRYASV